MPTAKETALALLTLRADPDNLHRGGAELIVDILKQEMIDSGTADVALSRFADLIIETTHCAAILVNVVCDAAGGTPDEVMALLAAQMYAKDDPPPQDESNEGGSGRAT